MGTRRIEELHSRICRGGVGLPADMDRVGPNIHEQRPPYHVRMLTANGQKE